MMMMVRRRSRRSRAGGALATARPSWLPWPLQPGARHRALWPRPPARLAQRRRLVAAHTSHPLHARQQPCRHPASGGPAAMSRLVPRRAAARPSAGQLLVGVPASLTMLSRQWRWMMWESAISRRQRALQSGGRGEAGGPAEARQTWRQLAGAVEPRPCGGCGAADRKRASGFILHVWRHACVLCLFLALIGLLKTVGVCLRLRVGGARWRPA